MLSVYLLRFLDLLWSHYLSWRGREREKKAEEVGGSWRNTLTKRRHWNATLLSNVVITLEAFHVCWQGGFVHTHTHTQITSSSPSHHRNTDRDVQVYMSIFEDLKRKILKSEMKSLKLWEICFCLFVFLPRTSQWRITQPPFKPTNSK